MLDLVWIHLDPCSSSQANSTMGAEHFFTVEDGGLSMGCNWVGHENIYVNPPYGSRGGESVKAAFFERAASEYRAGGTRYTLLLLKVAVGYAWFGHVLQYPHCLLRDRVVFVKGGAT